MPTFHWISKGSGSPISLMSFTEHIHRWSRFVKETTERTLKGSPGLTVLTLARWNNVCGVRGRDLRVLVLAHHTFSFTVALVYRESSRCSCCSTEPYWSLSPEEQSHWLCISWLSPGQWTCKCLDWTTHFGPEQSLLILGSQHKASFFSWSLEQKSEGDSVHGKTKAGGKETFHRKEAYDRTDGLPGTLIHLLTLVQTSPWPWVSRFSQTQFKHAMETAVPLLVPFQSNSTKKKL